MHEFDTLYTLAEIAVPIAGFSAIVVSFKRGSSGLWRSADADRFNGMLIHSMSAGFFCFFPQLVSVFTADPSIIWTIGSAIIGVQILAHAVLIFRLPTSDTVSRASMLFPMVIVVLQVLNVSGIYFSAEFGPYLAGVLWHIIQASVLFIMLVWVRAAEVEKSAQG